MNDCVATNPGSIAPARPAGKAAGNVRPLHTLLATLFALLARFLAPAARATPVGTRLLLGRLLRATLARTGAAWPRARITPAQRRLLHALRVPHTLPLPTSRPGRARAVIRRAALRLRLLRRGLPPSRPLFPPLRQTAAAPSSPTTRPLAQARPPPKNPASSPVALPHSMNATL